MRLLRSLIAWLLILATPLPAWAGVGAGHCAGGPLPLALASQVAAAEQVHDDHADHHATAHADGAQLTPAHDGPADAAHVSPCCVAVLPAPTSGAALSMAAEAAFAPLRIRFASVDTTPLRRPPRPTLA